MNTFRLCLLGIMLLHAWNLHAQDAVLSSGGEATGSGGSVSFSVGQTAYQTQTGQGISVAEGVQQPFETSANSILAALPVKLSAYPNPTQDQLILEIEQAQGKGLRYQLLDARGRLLTQASIQSSQTVIDLQQHASGTYFLKVSLPSGESSSFSILKN